MATRKDGAPKQELIVRSKSMRNRTIANNRKIVIGKSREQAALTMQPCYDATLFKGGIEQPWDGALGKILAALQGLPDLLLAVPHRTAV